MDAANNMETVSEILGAPHYLSNLTPDNVAMLRNLAAKALVPDKVALREESARALTALENATSDFTSKTTAKLRGWANKDADVIAAALTPGDES